MTGAGEVRYGARGRDAGRFLSLQQPGIAMYQDTRANTTVDLVIGPDWGQLASQKSIDKALAAQPTETAAC